MLFKPNQTPLTIVVHDGRWDAYGPVTVRSKQLYAILKNMGGINESVSDGNYHFNVERRGIKVVTTLEPIEQ